MPLTPKNRKEEWLQGLVDHETTLTPKNRPEEWMKEIIDASGGGGIDLGITGASAGEYAKIKTVDADGVPTAWESGSGGGLLFVTDNAGTLNKTWKEISDAAATGVVIWNEIDTDNSGNYFHFLGHTFYDNVYYWLEFDMPSRDPLYFKATSQTDYPVFHTE